AAARAGARGAAVLGSSASAAATARTGGRGPGDRSVTTTEHGHQQRCDDAYARTRTTLSPVHLSASARAVEQTPTSDSAPTADPSRGWTGPRSGCRPGVHASTRGRGVTSPGAEAEAVADRLEQGRPRWLEGSGPSASSTEAMGPEAVTIQAWEHRIPS